MKKTTHTSKPAAVEPPAPTPTPKPPRAGQETDHRYCHECGSFMELVIEHAPSKFHKQTGEEIVGAESRWWQCRRWTPDESHHDRKAYIA